MTLSQGPQTHIISQSVQQEVIKIICVPCALRSYFKLEEPTPYQLWSYYNMSVFHDVQDVVEHLQTFDQDTKDTMLLFAAIHENVHNMQILLVNGANLCSTPALCTMPIVHLLAIIPRSKALVYALSSQYSIEIDTVCDLGWTALLLATAHECYTNAYHLVQYGASLDSRIDPDESFSLDSYDFNLFGMFGFHTVKKPLPSPRLFMLLSVLLSQTKVNIPDRFRQDTQHYITMMKIVL